MRIDVSTINAIDAWNFPCILMFSIYCKNQILNIRHNLYIHVTVDRNRFLFK